MKYNHFFSPIKIRDMELNNRAMMPGMLTKLAKNHYVTEEMIDYYTARATGGVGLIMVEAAAVHTPTASNITLSLAEDEYIPGLKKLTESVHHAGGKIGIQLWQGGLLAKFLDPSVEAFVPSDVPFSSEEICKGASIEKIQEVVEAFGSAARRAVEAGFDCVEYHLGHGYSPHCFFSPAFNHRTDEYGGTFENYARYPMECIDIIRKNIPEKMPLFIRVVGQDDNAVNGLTTEDVIRFCNIAKEHGVDAIDVSRGNMFTSGVLECAPMDYPKGFNVEFAEKIKRGTGMFTIAVGRINDPEQADNIISNEQADMVAIGRGHIADPEFCNKAKSGNVDDIARCVGCMQGCMDIVGGPGTRHLTCLMNPAAGREREFENKKVEMPKKVLIAGGGIAGIEAAIVLRQRGHNVILAEKSDKLGGQFVIAGAAPRKSEFVTAINNRAAYAKKLGTEIRLNTEVTSNVIEEVKPDEVIITVGATPFVPDMFRGANVKVHKALDVLAGEMIPAGNVIVVGGGLVGIEVAELLYERGNKVTIVEMADEIGRDMGLTRKGVIMEILNSSEIDLMPNTKCVKVMEKAILVEQGDSQKELPADAIVLAVGSRPVDYSEIVQACEEKEISYHIAGDAKKVRRAIDAVAEAADIALAI